MVQRNGTRSLPRRVLSSVRALAASLAMPVSMPPFSLFLRQMASGRLLLPAGDLQVLPGDLVGGVDGERFLELGDGLRVPALMIQQFAEAVARLHIARIRRDD